MQCFQVLSFSLKIHTRVSAMPSYTLNRGILYRWVWGIIGKWAYVLKCRYALFQVIFSDYFDAFFFFVF